MRATTGSGPSTWASAPPDRMPMPWLARMPDWAKPNACPRPDGGTAATKAALAATW